MICSLRAAAAEGEDGDSADTYINVDLDRYEPKTHLTHKLGLISWLMMVARIMPLPLYVILFPTNKASVPLGLAGATTHTHAHRYKVRHGYTIPYQYTHTQRQQTHLDAKFSQIHGYTITHRHPQK